MRSTERMPTAAKLVSALGLAGLAWYATIIVKEIWPVDENFGYFSSFTALLALLIGWWVIGTRLGRGYMQGISAGLTGLFALLFWAFLLLSSYEMIERALDLRYKGPVQAITGVFDIAIGYAQNVYYWPLIGLLLAGAAVLGLIAEAVARRAA
ncbi:MAG: TrgA family protein [Roseovarius sp.]|nr:TrgA family protein [Roseovarius sp.]